jgi:chloramphenicol-sensitive protein RarD
VTNLANQAAEPTGAQATSGRGRQRAGLLYGLGAYTIWGFIPIYFHALARLPSLIVLCHRICWSALFLALVVSVRGEWKALPQTLRRRRNMWLLSAGAVFIALNWLIFIYAVATERLLQASLGYFITPLLSMVLGMVFFRERLRGWQWAAVLVAAGALVNLALRSDGFPWIAAALAGSFGFYGLVRKAVDIDSLHALTVEAGLLVPVALVLACVLPSGRVPLPTLGLLSLSGVITAVPLLSFGAALRRLRLSTVGFLQYWGPTLQFLVAWRLFHEPLEPAKARSFLLSWVAIGIYVADSLLSRQPQVVADEPE